MPSKMAPAAAAFDWNAGSGRDTQLNIWMGYGVEPCPGGSWALLRQHILENICRGNDVDDRYLTGWMARLVQHPAQQGEVAVVLRGGEGTGKGTLAKALLRLFGSHGFTTASAEHLTGRFNGHMRGCVFMFADEALYAGNKRDASVLKALVTEPVLAVEAKYRNAGQVPNFLHLMMASNADWVIPASLDSRRFFVLEVSPKRATTQAPTPLERASVSAKVEIEFIPVGPNNWSGR